MKKLIAITLAALLIFSFAACSNGSSDGNNTQAGTVKIADSKSIADLAGMKISAQQGTFHEKALTQIKDVKSSTYPEFSDLLTALKTVPSTATSPKNRPLSPSLFRIPR